jgi:hypothetical protein
MCSKADRIETQQALVQHITNRLAMKALSIVAHNLSRTNYTQLVKPGPEACQALAAFMPCNRRNRRARSTNHFLFFIK